MNYLIATMLALGAVWKIWHAPSSLLGLSPHQRAQAWEDLVLAAALVVASIWAVEL